MGRESKWEGRGGWEEGKERDKGERGERRKWEREKVGERGEETVQGQPF